MNCREYIFFVWYAFKKKHYLFLEFFFPSHLFIKGPRESSELYKRVCHVFHSTAGVHLAPVVGAIRPSVPFSFFAGVVREPLTFQSLLT